MTSLPILLKNPRILLIGGGPVALQKARVLQDNKIDFQIISRDFVKEFDGISAAKIQKKFQNSDINEFKIVVDATGDIEVLDLLLGEKRTRDFLLNVVDIPIMCDFYFSSLLNYGKLKIAISSDGSSPSATQVVRDEIKKIIPKNIDDFCQKQAIERTKGAIDKDFAKKECKKYFTQVYLIGCGLGNPELLTIKAYKMMQAVDVVLYDNLITKEILDLVPDSTMKIFVGKEKGNHNKTQDEINEMILHYVKQGFKVARLKSGDPFVFGRGAEEAIAMIKAGYKVEIINGLSSSIAGVSSAGIPVTARGYATNFSIVSAHLKDSLINLDWIHLLGIKNHTTVVLMGLSLCWHIQEKAYLNGISGDLKVAIISNASRENQKVKISTLENIYRDSLDMVSPALLVFGKVVGLSKIIKNI